MTASHMRLTNLARPRVWLALSILVLVACGEEAVPLVEPRPSVCPAELAADVVLTVRPPNVRSGEEAIVQIEATGPEMPYYGTHHVVLQTRSSGDSEWTDAYRLAGDLENPPSTPYFRFGGQREYVDRGALRAPVGPLYFRIPPLPPGEVRLCAPIIGNPSSVGDKTAAYAHLLVE